MPTLAELVPSWSIQGRTQHYLYARYSNATATSATYTPVGTYYHWASTLDNFAVQTSLAWGSTSDANAYTYTIPTWNQAREWAEIRAEVRLCREREREMAREHIQVGPAQSSRAGDRARELLLGCLTAEQRESFERAHSFLVVSNKGNVFRVRQGRVHNIHRLNAAGEPVEEWCVTPFGEIPVYDVMLMQKLALETDEDGLARRANITLARSGQMVRHAEVQYRPGMQPDYLRVAS